MRAENDRSADGIIAKLREVVLSKHGNPKTTTDKVCKYFIEAVENAKYGWFWVCPNGGDQCKYKHSLPPGYVTNPVYEVTRWLMRLQVRSKNERAACCGESTHGQITPENPYPRRLLRIRTA